MIGSFTFASRHVAWDGAARRPAISIATLALSVALSSCVNVSIPDQYDQAGITKSEYEGLLSRQAPSKEGLRREEPPIPEFQSLLAAPSAVELADTRRVSLAVMETTPVRDIIIELTRKAGVDLEMDTRISGGIILVMNDRPFADVIDRVCELAELRYTLSRNVLHVEIDDPYLEQYRMDVLNVTRTASGSASSSADASSAAAAVGSSGGGGNNRSNQSIDLTTSTDFWGTIGSNIQNILSGIQSRRSATGENVSATFVPQATAAPAAAPAAGGSAGQAPAAGAANPAGLVGQAAALQQAQGPLATDASQATLTASGGNAGGAPVTGNSSYSINAQAGIITIFATQRQHRAIERYLRDVRSSVMQQVLIEAKIMEVTLDDQYRAGIDWKAFLGPNDDFELTTNFNRSVVPPDFTDPTLGMVWANSQGDLSAAAQLVKQFGTVRTLSSPRMTVVNNQVALLKVAKNQVFFQIQVQTTDATPNAAAKTTVTSNIKTVPVGIVMSVQPAVDPVGRRISLGLRPSITRITGFVQDPGVAIQVAQSNSGVNVSSPIPIIEVRELDSMVSMESGQTIVMGGLMQEDVENVREGLPGVMDLPLLGQAVSQTIRQNKVSELVIFLRATLVNGRETVADEDIRLYKTFSPDPRPISF